MPKNPHPPRGSAKPKKTVHTTENIDDASHIIFTNGKREEKKSRKPEGPPQAENSTKVKTKSNESQNPSNQDEAPKKPDTRTLIGGASWTGKLPVNLLSEHCQKQKWYKPEYTMVRNTPACLSFVAKFQSRIEPLLVLCPQSSSKLKIPRLEKLLYYHLSTSLARTSISPYNRLLSKLDTLLPPTRSFACAICAIST